MYDNALPVGVVDSGIGGLTVLEQLIRMFPRENFVYVADRRYCPYGTKPPEQIGDRLEKVTRFLLGRGVKAIVVACNTASVRIERARAVADKPVISVIKPTCMKAVEATECGKVAVLATLSTIESGAYQRLLEEGGVTPVPLACGEFVDFLENCELSDPRGERLVREKLSAIKHCGMDTLIHGCTHFPLLEGYMRAVLGDINYVSCGVPAGESLMRILGERNLLNADPKKGRVQIFTTGDVESTLKAMKWFCAEHDPVRHTDIE